MGQSELLKIILGLMIIGIAIYVGMQLFGSNQIEADQRLMVNDIQQVLLNAKRYYIRPVAMGGGSKSFSGFSLLAKESYTQVGSYTVIASGNSLTITGTENTHTENTITYVYDASKTDWWKYPTITYTGDFK